MVALIIAFYVTIVIVVVLLILNACGVIKKKEQDKLKEETKKRIKNDYLDNKILIMKMNIGEPLDDLVFPYSEKQNLISNWYNKESLTMATSIILLHLGLDPKRYRVNPLIDVKGVDTKAGTFDNALSNKNINVILHEGILADQVIATLCHECAHAFLYDKGIRIESEKENEVLTDCAAVYLGMGEQLKNGYERFEYTIKDKQGRATNKTSKIGYIELHDIEYVEQYRNEILRKKWQINKFDASRNCVMEKCSILQEIIDRNDYIFNEIMTRRDADFTTEDYNLLMLCYRSVEDGEYHRKLSLLKDMTAGATTQDTLDKIASSVEELSTEITIRNSRFSKYM